LKPAQKYLEYLDSIFQVEPRFYTNESECKNIPGVTSIVYENIPEPGYITGLTYGLSLCSHPEWKYGRPELCLSVQSEDISWGQVPGFIANRLREKCPFCYGETINFKEKIADDSEMSAFFVFAPSIIDKNDYLDIDIGLDYKINIAGLYPIYESELKVINDIGLDAFWHSPGFDLYDINRKKIEAKQ
jgi:hypothetical protein